MKFAQIGRFIINISNISIIRTNNDPTLTEVRFAHSDLKIYLNEAETNELKALLWQDTVTE